jgi:hypothetical protein
VQGEAVNIKLSNEVINSGGTLALNLEGVYIWAADADPLVAGSIGVEQIVKRQA